MRFTGTPTSYISIHIDHIQIHDNLLWENYEKKKSKEIIWIDKWYITCSMYVYVCIYVHICKWSNNRLIVKSDWM